MTSLSFSYYIGDRPDMLLAPGEAPYMPGESFEKFQLNPIVLRGLARLGYDVPTPIQEAAIPAALRWDVMSSV